MTTAIIYGVIVQAWDDDVARPKDLIWMTPGRMFISLEAAKEWAFACAQTELTEYYEGTNEKPNRDLVWKYTAESGWWLVTNGYEEGVSFSHSDNSGFWVRVYSVHLRSHLAAWDEELSHFCDWSGGFWPWECDEHELDRYIELGHSGTMDDDEIIEWMEWAVEQQPVLK